MWDYMSDVTLIIFDWDGCLIDSFQLSYECYKEAFRKFNIKINKEIFKKKYSPDWLEMHKNFGINENTWRKINELWSKIYSQNIPPLCDDAKQLLYFLKKYNIKKVLLSSGSRERVLKELEHHLPIDLFSLIICREDFAFQKPNPKLLFYVLDLVKCPKGKAIYIGDTHYDAMMGKDADIITIIVKSGYSNNRKIKKVRPDYFVANLIDVEKILREMLDE